MSRIIKITETLYLVEVAKDAKNFQFSDGQLFYSKGDKCWYYSEKFDTNHKIHGIIVTPELSFDFEVDDSWVEKSVHYFGFFRNYIADFVDFRKSSQCKSKEDSFFTRIQKAIKDEGIEIKGNLILIGKIN